ARREGNRQQFERFRPRSVPLAAPHRPPQYRDESPPAPETRRYPPPRSPAIRSAVPPPPRSAEDHEGVRRQPALARPGQTEGCRRHPLAILPAPRRRGAWKAKQQLGSPPVVRMEATSSQRPSPPQERQIAPAHL